VHRRRAWGSVGSAGSAGGTGTSLHKTADRRGLASLLPSMPLSSPAGRHSSASDLPGCHLSALAAANAAAPNSEMSHADMGFDDDLQAYQADKQRSTTDGDKAFLQVRRPVVLVVVGWWRCCWCW